MFLAGGCKANPLDNGWGRGSRPVILVSWKGIAYEFLPWLCKTGRTYRLLTEAEWEYAARAGRPAVLGWAHGHASPGQLNWQVHYGRFVPGYFREKTIEVGSFEPNAFGLHDMHGNVWEWVEDCYRDNYAAAPTDGSAIRPLASSPIKGARGASKLR